MTPIRYRAVRDDCLVYLGLVCLLLTDVALLQWVSQAVIVVDTLNLLYVLYRNSLVRGIYYRGYSFLWVTISVRYLLAYTLYDMGCIVVCYMFVCATLSLQMSRLAHRK